MLAVCYASLAVTLDAQDQATAPNPPSPAAEPKFEVTSVKKSGPMPQMGMMFGLRPNGRFAMDMPVGALITLAYGIHLARHFPPDSRCPRPTVRRSQRRDRNNSVSSSKTRAALLR